MTTLIQEDHRLFERVAARFPVKYKDARDDFGGNLFLRDISAQGARLISHERLLINDNVILLVKIPDGHEPLNLQGQVVWAKSKMPGIWEAGLKFPKIRLMGLHRIFKFCE